MFGKDMMMTNTTADRYIVHNIAKWARDVWYGENYSFGRFWLGLAVFDAAMAALAVSFWPRALDPKIVAQTLTFNAVVWPMFICLGLASFCRPSGLRSWAKTLFCLGIITLITWLIWSPESQAWLEEVRRANR